ncbi:hypothetical protein ACQCQG_25455, partial [Ralstonia pseudosolanacearum]
ACKSDPNAPKQGASDADWNKALTYPHRLGFPLQRMLTTKRAFPYPVIGLVHLGHAIRQHRPLTPGECARVEVRPRRRLRHARGQGVVAILERPERMHG